MFIIIFLFSVGFISYKINNSYALFSDSVEGTKTIEVTPSFNFDKSGANAPVLDDGMIPVYYDKTTETWKKADEENSDRDHQWYDYNSKMWANSVTVSSTNRNKYKKADLGTEIPMDDILTMQVWIPRYKYKVWNYNANGTNASDEQQIEITFEKGTSTTGDIKCQDSISGTDGDASEICKIKSTNATCTDDTCNNKTYTHPAFTFGDEELNGFWVGKFELTGTINNITTKPNLSSLRNQNVSSFETNIMKMNDNGNDYGFNTSTDTHMIKNTEWGAVVYLSHSKYGTCTNGTCKEVNKNNSSSMYTGRSSGGSTDSPFSEGTYKYNQTNLITTTISGGTEVSFSTSGDIFPWDESEDGVYNNEMQSSDEIANLEFEFTAPSNDTYLSFDWRIEDGKNGDILYYTITKDGNALSDTGESTAITETKAGDNKPRKLEKGSYILTFTYEKNYNYSMGYVENIKVVDSPIVKEENIQIGEGKDGPSASTTHNVYGVYDMSGGTHESIMSNMISADGITMLSGYSASSNSGYTGIVRNFSSGSTQVYTGVDYPNSKYYDKYSYGAASDDEFKRSKLGDGIKEIYKDSKNDGWYGNFSRFMTSSAPWFVRGNNFMKTGIFSFFSDVGSADSYTSSRLIMTP